MSKQLQRSRGVRGEKLPLFLRLGRGALRGAKILRVGDGEWDGRTVERVNIECV